MWSSLDQLIPMAQLFAHVFRRQPLWTHFEIDSLDWTLARYTWIAFHCYVYLICEGTISDMKKLQWAAITKVCMGFPTTLKLAPHLGVENIKISLKINRFQRQSSCICLGDNCKNIFEIDAYLRIYNDFCASICMCDIPLKRVWHGLSQDEFILQAIAHWVPGKHVPLR